jgi:hypothetical protein
VDREDCKKDSGWIEKNGDWKSEDVSGVNKAIHILHIYVRTYVHTYMLNNYRLVREPN